MFLSRPAWLSRLPRPIALPFKAIYQFLVLLWMLLVSLPRPDVILLQLPPALPTMAVCWLAARRHRARLVYDWHNFAYTLMALTMGRAHALVRLAERYERFWAPRANASLCVTKAMKQELIKGWRTPATVFYDRPPEFFRRATLPEAHELLLRLRPTLKAKMHPRDFLALECSDNSTDGLLSSTLWTATEQSSTGTKKLRIAQKTDRPAIVVTSTSWTPDEDFSILLQAATQYDKRARQHNSELPRLVVLVTGQGPQRAPFEARMQELDLRSVAFRTVWLEPADYPVLLGCADIGVSLHSSSSGLDLPMKVVDMFGAGLPVLALSYSCIGELVAHGKNGLLFSSSEELTDALMETLRGFPEAAVVKRLARGVEGSRMARWHDSWTKTALPVLKKR